MADTSEVIPLGPIPELLPLDDNEYEGVRLRLMHNVSQALIEMLSGIDDVTNHDLLRLAHTDPLKLERLEILIRDSMREANIDEAKVSKFNLATYKRAAAHYVKRQRSDIARRKALKERNDAIMAAGGSKANSNLAELPEDAPFSVQSRIYSNSSFQKSIGLLQAKRSGRVWFDEFCNDFMSDWDGSDDDTVRPPKRIEDDFLLSVHDWLQGSDAKLATSSRTNTEMALHFFANLDRRNEPRDWLKGLVWDKVPRLETMLEKAFGCPRDALGYHAAVGRCWFVSMVARIMQPGCKVDTMPVLQGPQGAAKSTALEVIGGKWYGAINVSAEKTSDFIGALSGLVVAELPELDAISGRRVESSRVKSLLSTREDRYRPPYGRTTKLFKRTAVLVGTTNEVGWHKDETGGRRFWPLEIERIDLAWLKENREQLFAEALQLYKDGGKWWDVPEDEQRRRVMMHYTNDPMEERIENWLGDVRFFRGHHGAVKAIAGDTSEHEEWAHWGTLVTTNRIMTVLMQLPVERQSQSVARKVGQIMSKLGWKQHAIRLGSGRSAPFTRAWCETPSGGQIDDESGQSSLDIK